MEHFKERLHNNPEKLPYKQVDGHIILDVPTRENHYWSPQLHLEIREHKEDKNLSYLKGVLGPRAENEKNKIANLRIFKPCPREDEFHSDGIRPPI